MIPVLEVKPPVNGFEWITNNVGFDYLKPCNTGIPYANKPKSLPITK
jgi:hypothetical protein